MPVSFGIYIAVMYFIIPLFFIHCLCLAILLTLYLYLSSLRVLVCARVCLCVPTILLGFSLLMISSHPPWSSLNYSVALRALLGAD